MCGTTVPAVTWDTPNPNLIILVQKPQLHFQFQLPAKAHAGELQVIVQILERQALVCSLAFAWFSPGWLGSSGELSLQMDNLNPSLPVFQMNKK